MARYRRAAKRGGRGLLAAFLQIVPPPDETTAESVQPRHARGYSKSNLEPALREQGALERTNGLRKPGRPRVIASWFPAVAKAMADGTPLSEALKKNGITLDKAQTRAVYRNEEFKRLCQEHRSLRGSH